MSPLRLDRLITLYLARPLVRRRGVPVGWPILMYHSISDGGAVGAHAYYETNTTPGRFREQVRWLKDAGFHSVPLGAPAETAAQDKAVAITFDDGYRDSLTRAWPVLRECGFGATVFLATDYVGSSFKGRACLSWDEVRQGRREGIVFGSHTASHPELARLSDADVAHQWRASKDRIEQELGERIDLFSYPYAFPEACPAFVRRLRRILEDSGYARGVTTILGTVRDIKTEFFLPRLPVNSFDDNHLFRAKSEGAYNWLHNAQVLSKRVGRAIRRQDLRRDNPSPP